MLARALITLAVGGLLAACGGGASDPLPAQPSAAASAPRQSPGPGAGPSTAGTPRASGTQGTPGTTDDPGVGGGGVSTSEGGAGLEMPAAPEEDVESLSELLAPGHTAALVSTPLPRPASASGRLVTGFPAVLRPTRSTTVETSSVSPSGDRLQVALVASTRLAPEQVLVAYRGRLAARGLVELAAPPTAPGSQAVAFRRGRSVVTLTVTPAGPRTTYAVQASLRAGDR